MAPCSTFPVARRRRVLTGMQIPKVDCPGRVCGVDTHFVGSASYMNCPNLGSHRARSAGAPAARAAAAAAVGAAEPVGLDRPLDGLADGSDAASVVISAAASNGWTSPTGVMFDPPTLNGEPPKQRRMKGDMVVLPSMTGRTARDVTRDMVACITRLNPEVDRQTVRTVLWQAAREAA